MEITLQQFEAMCQNRQLHNGYVEGLGCVFWRSRYVPGRIDRCRDPCRTSA